MFCYSARLVTVNPAQVKANHFIIMWFISIVSAFYLVHSRENQFKLVHNRHTTDIVAKEEDHSIQIPNLQIQTVLIADLYSIFVPIPSLKDESEGSNDRIDANDGTVRAFAVNGLSAGNYTVEAIHDGNGGEFTADMMSFIEDHDVMVVSQGIDEMMISVPFRAFKCYGIC